TAGGEVRLHPFENRALDRMRETHPDIAEEFEAEYLDSRRRVAERVFDTRGNLESTVPTLESADAGQPPPSRRPRRRRLCPRASRFPNDARVTGDSATEVAGEDHRSRNSPIPAPRLRCRAPATSVLPCQSPRHLHNPAPVPSGMRSIALAAILASLIALAGCG